MAAPIETREWQGGWIFVGFTCLYLLLGGGHIYSPDGVVMFRVTESLLDGEGAAIEPLANWPTFGGVAVVDPDSGAERFFAKYGLGQSLAAIPAVLVGRALAPLVPVSERGLFDTPSGIREGGEEGVERAGGGGSSDNAFGSGNPFRVRWDDWSAAAWPLPFVSFAASWTNAGLVAATLALLFAIARELGYGVRPSLGLVLLAGLATPLAHYAKTFFAEPLAGLAFAAFFLLAIRASRRERGRWHLFGAGLALGLCVLAKIAHVVLLGPAGAFVVALLWRRVRSFARPGHPSAVLASLGSFAAGVALPLAGIAAYGTARFGTWFETGYGDEAAMWTTPFLEGFAGMLVSPGRGLLVFAPLLWLALVGTPRFARRFPLEAGFIGLSLLALLCTYARWHMWEGGWCWGPRFLVPVLPLLLLPLVGLLEGFAAWPLRTRLACGGVVGLSLAVTTSGLVVNFVDFHNYAKLFYEFQAEAFAASGIANYLDLIRWDWRFSPLVATWSFPVKDYFLLPHAVRQPGLVLTLYGVWSLLLAVSVFRIGRGLQPRLRLRLRLRRAGLTGSEAPASR
jgi:hypothetical protein